MRTIQWWFLGVGAAAILAMPDLVRSQTQYPSRPVTLTVTFAAGGSSDLVSRIVGDKLSARFGQPFVIENRGGGGGEVGMTAVARSAPDGYRLVVTSGGSVAIASNFRQVSYDAETDFTPVAMIEKTPCVVAVDASLPIKTIADLVKYSKEKPGGLSYGNSGPGSMFWAAGEILRHRSGANMVSVPYQGAILTARAIRAGEIDMGIVDLTAVMPFVQEGKIRIIAVTDATRSSLAPDIPTVSESIPGLGLSAWIGVFAPRGTPVEIVDQLNAGINEALRMPDVRQRILNAGLEPWVMSPQQMREFVRQEIVLWKDLIREANVKAQ